MPVASTRLLLTVYYLVGGYPRTVFIIVHGNRDLVSYIRRRLSKRGEPTIIFYEIFDLRYHSTRSPSPSDVIIIAIDFEDINTINSGFSQKNTYQVGLAILDTRSFTELD